MSLVLLAGCSGKPAKTSKAPAEEDDGTRAKVFVVSYPLAYFAERIGGEAVAVTFPVPADQDPARWDPDGDEIAAFQTADLVLLNGADYAKWTLRASLPWTRTVVTTRDVEEKYIKVPNAVTHTHGPEGEHSHAGIASETWLDPQLAIAQARVIKDELLKALPESTAEVNSNFDKLSADLKSIDQKLATLLSAKKFAWTASHPGFRYLCRRYSLEVSTMNWDPVETPSDEQWKAYDKIRATNKSMHMLWTAQPNEATRSRLRKQGVSVVVFQPVTHRPASGDYLTVMNENLKRLEAAISQPPSS